MDSLKKLWKIFIIFFKIGSFTFGGGMAMLPLIEKEVVDKEKWISEDEIVNIFAVSQSLPGVIAINSSIFVGNKVYGIPGAIVAALGVILPAFFSIIIAIFALMNIKDSPYVTKVFGGIKAASAALILLSAIKLGRSAVKDKVGLIIAVISFIMITVLQINAVWANVLSGLAGYLVYNYSRRKA